MPERKCDGCRKQVEWGCHAKPHTVIDAKGKETVKWDKPARIPLSLLGVDEWWACPRQTVRENPGYWSAVLRFYAMYRRGFLPDPGAVVDQSNKLVDILRVIDDVNQSCDQEEMRQNARNGGAPPQKGRPGKRGQ